MTWLEDLLDSPTTGTTSSASIRPLSAGSVDNCRSQRLSLLAEIGPLVNSMGQIGECLGAVEGFLRALNLDFRVHEVRYRNPLILSIDVDALEVARTGGTFGAAYYIARAIERLTPIFLEHSKEMKVIDADIEDRRAGRREAEARSQVELDRLSTDNQTEAERAEIETEIKAAEARRDIAKADRERQVNEILAELVGHLGQEEVDPRELLKRAETLLDLEIRASNDGDPVIDEGASTQDPIDLRVVPTENQGK